MRAPVRAQAEIIAFPIGRCQKRVDDIARALVCLEHDDARELWKLHTRKLRTEMKTSGLKPSPIKVEIDRYAEAVARQLFLLRDYRGVGGGDPRS